MNERNYKDDYRRKLKDCLYWMNRAKRAEAKLEAEQHALRRAAEALAEQHAINESNMVAIDR